MDSQHERCISEALAIMEQRRRPDIYTPMRGQEGEVGLYLGWNKGDTSGQYTSIIITFSKEQRRSSGAAVTLVVPGRNIIVQRGGISVQLDGDTEYDLTYDHPEHDGTPASIEGLADLLRSAIEVPLRV